MNPEQQEVEKQLIPRLKWMGGILLLSALCSLGYALFLEQFPPETPILEEASLIPLADVENSHEVLNYFVVSTIFATIGVFCFLIAMKKQKQ